MGVHLYKPGFPDPVILHQLSIIRCVHLPCPYDFGGIDVSVVVNPLIKWIPIRRIANKDNLLARKLLQRSLDISSFRSVSVGTVPHTGPVARWPFLDFEAKRSGEYSHSRQQDAKR